MDRHRGAADRRQRPRPLVLILGACARMPDFPDAGACSQIIDVPVRRRRPAKVVSQARRQAARPESPAHIGITAGGQLERPQFTDHNALM